MKQHVLQSGEVRPPIWGGLKSRFLTSISLGFVPLHFSWPSLSSLVPQPTCCWKSDGDPVYLYYTLVCSASFFQLTLAEIELFGPNNTIADSFLFVDALPHFSIMSASRKVVERRCLKLIFSDCSTFHILLNIPNAFQKMFRIVGGRPRNL